MTQTLLEKIESQLDTGEVEISCRTDLLTTIYIEGNGFTGRILVGDGDHELKFKPVGTDNFTSEQRVNSDREAVSMMVEWVAEQEDRAEN